MENQQTPQVLAQPFAAQGDKNTIPNAATGTNKASLQEGFPPITGQPINQGGIPPERQDFNGAMNLNSQFYFAFQNGWWPTFSQEVSDAIGGYPQNAILCYFVPASNSVQFVRSLIPNNTYNFVTTPSYIGQYWVKCLMESAGLPMGAVYYSQSALTSDNPGAVPAWQGVFEQNGSQTYPEFFSWITSHTELCITKTEYDSDITTYGECPFYVLNETTAGNLRFPQLVNYIKNANSTDGITQSAAGLPDHSHAISQNLYAENGNTNNNIASGGNTQDATLNISTGNASASNSIYGASDTVTPAHTTLYPWIVVNPSATSISQCVLLSQVGTANGVASLDDNACVPFAQMPAEVVDNIDIPFDPSAYNWPDIRPSAWPNAIVLMAGVKADYSAYDNLGFKATCEGGYNVFIDGVQYGQTYASGAQCSITWSQYSATTGFSVAQPQALTAHIVQIVPAVAGNNISAFKCVRVATSGQEMQGVLWVHFNLHTAIDIQALLQDYAALYCPVCKAITAVNDLLKATNAQGMSGQGADRYSYGAELDYCVPLDFSGASASLQSVFNMAGGNNGQLRVVRLKNITATDISSLGTNAKNLQEIKTEGASLQPTSVTRAFLNCPQLKRLPQIDFTNTTAAIDFVKGASALTDTILDLSYANLLSNFHFYNTPGLKGLLVSPRAPFDYASAPQINVAYTGLDQAALVALFKSLPYNVGYTVVGNPTIQDGVASGFSANDLLSVSGKFAYSAVTEIVIKFRVNSSFLGSQKYANILSNPQLVVHGNTSDFSALFNIPGIGDIGLGKLTPDTDYWVKYLNDGTTASSWISENGSSWTQKDSKDSTGLSTDIISRTLYFGGRYIGDTERPAFDGDIDVAKSYIKISGVPWFRGTAAMDKTINITGATGAAALTAEQLAIATDKGWTVTR